MIKNIVLTGLTAIALRGATCSGIEQTTQPTQLEATQEVREPLVIEKSVITPYAHNADVTCMVVPMGRVDYNGGKCFPVEVRRDTYCNDTLAWQDSYHF